MEFKLDAHDDFVVSLLNHSLEMNEYSKQHSTVDTEHYISLLNEFIKCAQNSRDYFNGMQGLFSDASKLGGRK